MASTNIRHSGLGKKGTIVVFLLLMNAFNKVKRQDRRSTRGRYCCAGLMDNAITKAARLVSDNDGRRGDRQSVGVG